MTPRIPRGLNGLAILVGATFLAYVVTGLIVATLARQPVGAPLLTPEVAMDWWYRPELLLFGLSGVSIALIVPSVAWIYVLARGSPLRPGVVFHRAFALNLVQATLFLSVWKLVVGEPARGAFMVWQAFVSAAGLVVLRRLSPGRLLRPETVRPLLAAFAILLIALPLFLWGKTFIEDGSGDGTEAFEFARSLSSFQLPRWDLENGYYGFYPQYMLSAYPAQLSFVLLGENEAGLRLPVFFYLFGITLTLMELIRRRRRQLSVVELSALLGAAVYFLAYNSEHSTYELVTDLGELTGPDTLFAFIALSAVYALVSRQRLWWGLLAVLSCMTTPAGLPFTMLVLLGSIVQQTRRVSAALRASLRPIVAFFLPWIAYQVLVKIYQALNPTGELNWELSLIADRYPISLSADVTMRVIGSLAIAVAVFPLVGLFFLSRRDAVMRILGTVLLGYLGLLALFGRMHPHYMIPLSLIPAALFLRGLAARQMAPWTRQAGHVLYIITLSGMTIAAVPTDRTPHTAYRTFGSQTLFLTDSYPASIASATQVLTLRPELALYYPTGKPLRFSSKPRFTATDWSAHAARYLERPIEDAATLPWGLSHHLWVRYSDTDRVPGRRYLQVIAAPGKAPEHLPGYSRQELPGGWVLFCTPQSIFAVGSTTRSPVSVQQMTRSLTGS